MTQEQKKWYDNKVLTNILLIVFFPVGLYALWKSNTIAKWWKITATIIIGLIVIANIGDGTKNDVNSSNSTVEQEKNCSYSKVEIKAFRVGTDELLDEKLINGCFEKKIVDESLGLVEITNESKTIKVSYYIESDPKVLRFLDVKIGESEPSRWRANQGHDLFIVEKDGDLNFIFGDRKKSKIKGTIKFMK